MEWSGWDPVPARSREVTDGASMWKGSTWLRTRCGETYTQEGGAGGLDCGGGRGKNGGDWFSSPLKWGQ